MTAESQSELAEPLLAQLSGRCSADELDRVRNAYEFAARWHEGQQRQSGEQFITHSVAVAEAAAAARLNCTMICAALLHDVLEGTDCEPEPLRSEFGDEVADLVERLSVFRYGAGTTDDDRVITIRLLDRLHNMQTIEHIDTSKQLVKSRETLELVVPDARRLGLAAVADQLQELARRRIEVLTEDGGGEIAAMPFVLQLGSLLLPAVARARYLEEWAAEMRMSADKGTRRRFAWQLLLGLPRMSVTARRARRCAR